MHSISRSRWYIERFRRMTPSEVFKRASLSVRNATEQMMMFSPAFEKTSKSITINRDLILNGLALPNLTWDLAGLERDVAALEEASIEYAQHIWKWRKDGVTWSFSQNGSWSQQFYSRLDCRSGNPHGDPRITWEPNRLQHFIGLALIAAHKPARRARALQLLREQLSDWIEKNPVGYGINYVSSMECSLRILSVLFAAHIVRNLLSRDSEFWMNVDRLVSSHALFVVNRLSLGSSLGNHTVAEAAGLYCACMASTGSAIGSMQRYALKALRLACEKEFLPDGGGAEQSPSYHALILDLLHVITRTARLHGQSLHDIEEYHERGAMFLRGISRDGELPNIGDSDSSFSLSRYLAPTWKSSGITEVKEGATSFPDAGISIIRRGQIALWFNHSSLGMPPNFAHGHADALSVVLSLAGRPILIDPGTYSYLNTQGWRDYFRSASAHNTLHGGLADQAINLGPFLWSKTSNVRLLEAFERNGSTVMAAELLADHNYRHVRALSLDEHCLIVVDRISGIDPNIVRMRWHFDAELIPKGASYVLSSMQDLEVSLPRASSKLYRASSDPRAGWMSREYGSIEPATTLEASFPIEDAQLETIITFPGASATSRAQVSKRVGALEALVKAKMDGGLHVS